MILSQICWPRNLVKVSKQYSNVLLCYRIAGMFGRGFGIFGKSLMICQTKISSYLWFVTFWLIYSFFKLFHQNLYPSTVEKHYQCQTFSLYSNTLVTSHWAISLKLTCALIPLCKQLNHNYCCRISPDKNIMTLKCSKLATKLHAKMCWRFFTYHGPVT